MFEDKLAILRNDKTLETIVKQLNFKFPDCSITTDLEVYPFEDGVMDIVVIGAPKTEVIPAIQEVIPSYSLESADRDEFSVFVCLTEKSPFPHSVKDLWR